MDFNVSQVAYNAIKQYSILATIFANLTTKNMISVIYLTLPIKVLLTPGF